jgi:hypothetical protein
VISLVYVSRALVPFDADALGELLAQSRTDNLRRGLSGILLHKDGQFMQAIEGPEDMVDEVFSSIAADPRHELINTLLREPIQERQFPSWTMGYREIDDDASTRLGFDPFFNSRRDPRALAESGSRARMLLDWFRVRALVAG